MKIANNRYLDALLKLMLFSAIFHMILLVIYAIRVQSILPLNYFNILDVDLLYPIAINGNVAQIFAGGFALALWIVFYIFFTKED